MLLSSTTFTVTSEFDTMTPVEQARENMESVAIVPT